MTRIYHVTLSNVCREREREKKRESPQLRTCRVNPARFVIARGWLCIYYTHVVQGKQRETIILSRL